MQTKTIKMICGYREIPVSELEEIADALGCNIKISFVDKSTGKEF